MRLWMQRMLRLACRIDGLSDRLGRAVAWLTIIMIGLGALNALARYLNRVGLDLASNAYIEAQWYLFSAVFLLGAASALREDAHVRVDVIYGRLAERTRAWIDLLGGVLFLIPFGVVAIVVSWPAVSSSWQILEVSPDPGGLPRYPIKTLIPIAFALVILQGLAQILRIVGKLSGSGPEGSDSDAASASSSSDLGGEV